MTITQVPKATVQIDWTHPARGRTAERVCGEHERQILSALRTLGIGCTGERYAGPLGCGRCLAEVGGVDIRIYLDKTGAAPDPDTQPPAAPRKD